MSEQNLSKKIYHWGSTLIGVVGLVLTVWSIYQPSVRRSIFYSFSQPVQVLSKTAIINGLQVKNKSNNNIVTDVYKTDMYLWNASDLTLRSDDIVEPIQIKFNNSKLVNVTITKVVVNNIAKIKIDNTQCDNSNNNQINAQSIKNNVINLHWCLLDVGFGVRITLLYTGAENLSVTQSGYITGISDVSNQTPGGLAKITTTIIISIVIIVWIVISLLLGLTLNKAISLLLKSDRIGIKSFVRKIIKIASYPLLFLIWLAVSSHYVEQAQIFFNNRKIPYELIR